MKILIADDDPFYRRLLESHLEKAGMSVVSVADGESAVAAYKKNPLIGMAILDWMMPGMSGLEVCQELKSDPNAPFMYVIIITSKSNPKDLANALNSGADDFISKPYNNLELTARINAGARLLNLQNAMMEHIGAIGVAENCIARLQEICSTCHASGDKAHHMGDVEAHISQCPDADPKSALCNQCVAHQESRTPSEAPPISP